MNTDLDLAKQAYEAGLARAVPPEAYSPADGLVVARAYAAGLRAAERREAGPPQQVPQLDAERGHEPGA